MTEKNHSSASAFRSAARRHIPRLVFLLCLFVLLAIPFKIESMGFQPSDDALRHVAKVVSGKNWQEILVLRPELVMDSHPGWHFLLGIVLKTTHAGMDRLLSFSVIFLFFTFAILPLFYFRRPETWLLALLVMSLFIDASLFRLFSGRPFLISMAAFTYLCLNWRKLRIRRTPWPVMAGIFIAVTASVWMHCSWFLWAPPVAAFFLAREWRASFRLSACVAAGLATGAILTGHPILFIWQTLMHAFNSVDAQVLARQLVEEFQPWPPNPYFVLFIAGLLVWRKQTGTLRRSVVDNPVFILALIGWICGFHVFRFWFDIGLPAFLAWIALQFRAILRRNHSGHSANRLLVAALAGGLMFLTFTADTNSRWTNSLTRSYVDASRPELKDWMPGPGGIFYSADMLFFMHTFYKNPHGDWKYVMGFEPSMMPPDDLAIYQKIRWNYFAQEAFEPWVKKLRPQDRLVINLPADQPPNIPALKWKSASRFYWIGRLPARPAGAAPSPASPPKIAQ